MSKKPAARLQLSNNLNIVVAGDETGETITSVYNDVDDTEYIGRLFPIEEVVIKNNSSYSANLALLFIDSYGKPYIAINSYSSHASDERFNEIAANIPIALYNNTQGLKLVVVSGEAVSDNPYTVIPKGNCEIAIVNP